MISVPEDLLPKGGRLYRRVRNAAEQREYLLAQEEPLDHVFDIAFGIAPDALVEDALLKPLGLTDGGKFGSIGREARERYQHIEKAQFQQQDGFFVSQDSAIGVELKLGSRSSPGDQCLCKLIDGVLGQIAGHKLTGLQPRNKIQGGLRLRPGRLITRQVPVPRS